MQWAQGACSYLRSAGPLSAATADAVLCLDNGERLPVHSSVLALHCPVVEMLLSDFSHELLSGAHLHIPLPDEPLGSAQAFLALLYCPDLASRGCSAPNRAGLQPAELDAACRLADKLGAVGVAALCEAIARGCQPRGLSGCAALFARQAALPAAEAAGAPKAAIT